MKQPHVLDHLRVKVSSLDDYTYRCLQKFKEIASWPQTKFIIPPFTRVSILHISIHVSEY